MKHTNELKVGLAIVIAVVAFVMGVRYFRDVPLFTGTYDVRTELPDAKGLIPGNPVRINGVKVGAVKSVTYVQTTNMVEVVFRVNDDIVLPEGTVCTITGIDALTGIRVELKPGPIENPPIGPGGFVPNVEQPDFVNDFASRAPELVRRVDSLLVGLDATVGGVREIVARPESDLRQTLVAIRSSAAALEDILRQEHNRVTDILDDVKGVSGNLSALSSSQGDSVKIAIQTLNSALKSMESSMTSLQSTTSQMDDILAKVDNGTGTLGKLINDPGLYNQLDSMTTNMSELLADFKRNPRKYLREMKLVEIF